MSYTLEHAALLARQLEKLATARTHHAAPQFANLEFWLAEVEHVIATIREYPQRFRRLRDAQQAWVRAHGTRTTEHCLHCGGPCDLGPQPPAPPTRISSDEMEAAQRDLQRAAYRLLLRGYRIKMVDEPALMAACARIGMTLERDDLRGDALSATPRFRRPQNGDERGHPHRRGSSHGGQRPGSQSCSRCSMKLRIHRLAVVEIGHEVDYYESRQPGLGADLEDELEAVFATILQFLPESCTTVEPRGYGKRPHVLKRIVVPTGGTGPSMML
ncbi:MAG: hypothetical protein H0T46_30450 [Deltaproteobacteria bacterium]|nr:hypothetical protein [Deltaproteobacteria bacterium]